jgi:hypothetical protein
VADQDFHKLYPDEFDDAWITAGGGDPQGATGPEREPGAATCGDEESEAEEAGRWLTGRPCLRQATDRGGCPPMHTAGSETSRGLR